MLANDHALQKRAETSDLNSILKLRTRTNALCGALAMRKRCAVKIEIRSASCIRPIRECIRYSSGT
jgi:hypothetical protein